MRTHPGMSVDDFHPVVKKISELVDRHPEEAVNIMRGWMYAEP